MTESNISKFIRDQLSVWPLASENYRNLKNARFRNIDIDGLEVTLQLNPCRRISSEAVLDKQTISARPCFLCPENRPKEQFNIEFEGRKGRKYRITLNPYPIFPSHLVVSSFGHTPQSIWHRYPDMLDFVHSNPEFVSFYNGPESGASAPDHMHFQACPAGMMPLERKVNSILDSGKSDSLEYLSSVREASLYHFSGFARGIFILRASTAKSIVKLFYRLLDCAPVKEGDSEPRFNLLTWFSGEEYRSAVIFRDKHRSHHYFSSGEDHLAVSPGAADMAGLFVAPEVEDYDKMDPRLLKEVISEVTLDEEEEKKLVWRLTRTQGKLEVGIMSAKEIVFEIISDGAGPQKVSCSEGKISYNGALYDELTFDEQTLSTMFAEPSFILYGVTIGVDFHWERKVTQKFAGTLKFIPDSGKVIAIDMIGVEDYLLSVISSEMKASAGLEFLKAHAVISRSWVMAQIANRRESLSADRQARCLDDIKDMPSLATVVEASLEHGSSASVHFPADGGEYVKWFDHDDHRLFDVCADDHCQRYQGLTMAAGDTVRKAIDQTWGLVLTSGGKICDARFSKCCGGKMELFSSCWEDKDFSYLQPLPDTPDHDPAADPFCDTADDRILSQVLNDYDLETKDFYRWTAEYDSAALSELVNRRSGFGFGDVLALIPVERGPSGRIIRLRIAGSKMTLTVGKELIIRKFLSESHLKSSAFEVHYLDAEGKEVPAAEVEAAAEKGSLVWSRLVLKGSGWGHGVGLCQIGAAVMASRGYGFREILSHYYPGSELSEKKE